jgi:hypothetical protein
MEPRTLEALTDLCLAFTHMAETIRNQTNAVVSTQEHVEVIKHYDKLRHANAMIKETKDALTKIEERLSREQVPDVMRANKIRSTTIEGVGRVSLGTRWSASMTDKQEGFNWLRGSGNGGVIQETVNAQTLGALAKELNGQGIELPAPTFTTSVMTYTSITKI